ncbi:MAG: DNA polymerase III subunit alpha [Planctomycetes bacterium]|nr:DNA polymerase III subunit alpha [Planctomycetota bacterium]
MNIINIALRSEFTFKRVFQTVESMTDNQESAVGIADLNSTQGFVSFSNVCKAADIKPIFGATVMAVHDVERKVPRTGQYGFEYTVIAKNDEGLPEIYRLVKSAFDNFYYRPQVSIIDIWGLSDNVIVIASAFNIPERIDYLGLSQSSNLSCMKYGLPTVAINENDYPKPSDRMAYELLMGSREMNTKTTPQHIMSTTEWRRFFKGRVEDLETPIKNTHAIAEMCEAELKIAEPVKYRGDDDLYDLIEKGIKDRKYNMTKTAKKRIKSELKLIEGKEFADYFLVVSQMTSAAKKYQMVGPGRGSAGGSLVCFLLGITEVDPLKFDLLFERFLDKHRHDAPDIDIDFPDKHREKVIDNLIEDNGGAEFVCKLGIVARQRGDSLINKFSSEMQVPFEAAEELKEVLIQRPAGDARVNFCVVDTLTSTEIGKNFAKMHPAINEAVKYEGHATHSGTHAAGILVCNEPITNYTGVNSRDGFAMIDYREAEMLNLLKIDALGLRTLSILQETAELAGFDWRDFYSVNLEDEAALQMFKDVRLLGIFQFEGQALSGLCRQMEIKSFSEIAAVTALGRPGPLKGGGTAKYIARQTGKEEVSYTANHPAVINNTRETFGVIVYQEQLMHICRDVGMSWKDVSMFRKIVAKRKGRELLGTYEATFKKCAIDKGLSKMEAAAVWSEMVTFGEYGFNKSHAVAYAMISQNCAWAKAHHPFEFAVASLNNSKSDDSAVRLLRDLVRHEGFSYVPVDPDKSEVFWSAQEGVLVGGLINIDGIAEKKAKTIVRNRENGKIDPPSVIKMLANPETPFDILFPVEEFWGEYFYSPEDFGLKERPSYIEDINEKGDYTFIGKLTRKKVKDLNTIQEIEKRDGEVYKENTVCLNLTLEDDTSEIMARIPRNKFDEFANEIIERDDFKERKDVNWYIIKGRIISDEIRFIFINNIHYLGEEH